MLLSVITVANCYVVTWGHWIYCIIQIITCDLVSLFVTWGHCEGRLGVPVCDLVSLVYFIRSSWELCSTLDSTLFLCYDIGQSAWATFMATS